MVSNIGAGSFIYLLKRCWGFILIFSFCQLLWRLRFLEAKASQKKEWEQNKWKHVHQNIDESIKLKECNKKYVNQNTITLLSKLLHQCQSLKREKSRNGRCWNYFVYMAYYVYYSLSKKRRKSKNRKNKQIAYSQQLFPRLFTEFTDSDYLWYWEIQFYCCFCDIIRFNRRKSWPLKKIDIAITLCSTSHIIAKSFFFMLSSISFQTHSSLQAHGIT